MDKFAKAFFQEVMVEETPTNKDEFDQILKKLFKPLAVPADATKKQRELMVSMAKRSELNQRGKELLASVFEEGDHKKRQRKFIGFVQKFYEAYIFEEKCHKQAMQ